MNFVFQNLSVVDILDLDESYSLSSYGNFDRVFCIWKLKRIARRVILKMTYFVRLEDNGVLGVHCEVLTVIT